MSPEHLKNNILIYRQNYLRIARLPAPFILAAIKWIIYILMLVMSIAVFAQVLYRKFLEGAIPWSEELARYLFVWCAWLGAAIGVQRKSHFGIDLLVRYFPATLHSIVRFVVVATGTFFLSIAIWKGFVLAAGNWYQLSPAMRIPMTFPYLSVPIGAALMLYFWLVTDGEESK